MLCLAVTRPRTCAVKPLVSDVIIHIIRFPTYYNIITIYYMICRWWREIRLSVRCDIILFYNEYYYNLAYCRMYTRVLEHRDPWHGLLKLPLTPGARN